MSGAVRARPGPRPTTPAPTVRLLKPLAEVPAEPQGLSVKQRRRWVELWSHPAASRWDPVEAGAMVVELIRLEAGVGSLTSRETDQLARLRRDLLLTINARRRNGVAIPTDPHAAAARPAAARDSAPRLVMAEPTLDDIDDMDADQLFRLSRRCRIDDGIGAGPVHWAALARLQATTTPTPADPGHNP